MTGVILHSQQQGAANFVDGDSIGVKHPRSKMNTQQRDGLVLLALYSLETLFVIVTGNEDRDVDRPRRRFVS